MTRQREWIEIGKMVEKLQNAGYLVEVDNETTYKLKEYIDNHQPTEYRYLELGEIVQEGDEYEHIEPIVSKNILYKEYKNPNVKIRRKLSKDKYRYLEKGELILKGDEYCSIFTNLWNESNGYYVKAKVGDMGYTTLYRRKYK